jgi:hypothetical protein
VIVAVFAPYGTVMLTGTETAGFDVESAMTAPPVGAAPLRVAVTTEEAPPTTVAGATLTEFRLAERTVRFALFVTPAEVAEIEITVSEETPDVDILNVVLVEPAGIVTELGAEAMVLSVLLSVTT